MRSGLDGNIKRFKKLTAGDKQCRCGQADCTCDQLRYVTALVDYNILERGTVHLVNVITTGASISQRIGSVVKYKKVHVKASILRTFANVLANSEQMYASVDLVWDKQHDGGGGAVNYKDIFDGYGSGAVLISSTNPDALPFIGINPDRNDRFTLLRRKFLLLPSIGVGGTLPASYEVVEWNTPQFGEGMGFQFNWEVDLSEYQSVFPPGATGFPQTGALYLCTFLYGDPNIPVFERIWNIYGCVNLEFYE